MEVADIGDRLRFDRESNRWPQTVIPRQAVHRSEGVNSGRHLDHLDVFVGVFRVAAKVRRDRAEMALKSNSPVLIVLRKPEYEYSVTWFECCRVAAVYRMGRASGPE